MADYLQNPMLVLLILFIIPNNVDPSESVAFSGKDVTPLLFGLHNEEIFPVAYGDFNSDKITDIFAVSRDRSDLRIYFGHEEPPLFHLGIECKLRTDWESKGFLGENQLVYIVGVTPADFTGDGILDVMVAFQRNSSSPNPIEVIVFRGNLTTLDCDVQVNLKQTIAMIQEPLLLDVNGDMIMDMFGERFVPNKTVVPTTTISPPTNKTTTTTAKPLSTTPAPKPLRMKEMGFWMFGKDEDSDQTGPVNPPEFYHFYPNEKQHSDPYDTFELANPHANAFVDVDGDLVPELVLVMANHKENGSKVLYQIKVYRVELKGTVQYRDGFQGDFSPTFTLLYKPLTIDHHEQTQVVGQPLFVDLNQEGKLVSLIPFCTKKSCRGASGIKLISHGEKPVNIDLPIEFDRWHFLPKFNISNPQNMLDSNYTETLILRVGDFNLDGFPDLIGILRNSKVSASMNGIRAMLFENVPCVPQPPDLTPCANPRTFKINFDAFAQYENVVLATFFDIHEDGLVDVILVRRTNNATTKNADTYGIFAFENSPDYDANFMKVMVLTGRPCLQCPKSQIPYGNVISGSVIKYHTTTQAGNHQTAIAAQNYRSSHMTLDLPYTIFGIGQSPNFIEELQTAVSTTSGNRSQEWPQIIPNSQIIVVPYPIESPTQWSAKLFLTPSRAVLNTFGVLVGFCGLIFIIVAGLQFKEQREDRKDRLQEAHRFHMM